MYVTWTVMHMTTPTAAAPWTPTDATWSLAGRSSPGRAQAPEPDGLWWSVIATWADPTGATAGPPPSDDVQTWHVVMTAASSHGDLTLADGARPFEQLREGPAPVGPVALITVAGDSRDDGREREFARRFQYVARDVGRAPGHLVSLVQAPARAPGAGPILVFSAWRDLRAGLDWAYESSSPHRSAVARQRQHRLVELSGSLRCGIVSSRGALGDLADPLAGMTAWSSPTPQPSDTHAPER